MIVTETSTSGTKVCSTCRVEQPVDQFHREARRKDGRDPRCRPCRAVARRQGDAAPCHATPSVPPDPQPAVRLREELLAARRAGVSFEEAWEVAVTTALDAVESRRHLLRERMDWENAMWATRGAWSSAYCREDALAAHQAVAMLAAA